MADLNTIAIAGLCGFLVGCIYGIDHMRDENERAAAIAAAQQGARDYAKLTKAIDIQDSVRADLSRARAESDRMRKLLAHRETAAPKGGDGTGASGCPSLLRDGVELLGSCRERLLECAGKHDALVEIAK